jgi:hypothetical protein
LLLPLLPLLLVLLLLPLPLELEVDPCVAATPADGLGWPCASRAAWQASNSHCRVGTARAFKLAGMGQGSSADGKRVDARRATLDAGSRWLVFARATPCTPCWNSQVSGSTAGSGAALQNMSSKSASDSGLPASRTYQDK